MAVDELPELISLRKAMDGLNGLDACEAPRKLRPPQWYESPLVASPPHESSIPLAHATQRELHAAATAAANIYVPVPPPDKCSPPYRLRPPAIPAEDAHEGAEHASLADHRGMPDATAD